MAGFDGENAASGGEEGRVVGEESATAEVGANAAGGDHVGCVDKGDGVGGGGELVRAWRNGVVASVAQDGSDGLGVGVFMLKEVMPLEEKSWGGDVEGDILER